MKRNDKTPIPILPEPKCDGCGRGISSDQELYTVSLRPPNGEGYLQPYNYHRQHAPKEILNFWNNPNSQEKEALRRKELSDV